MFGKKKQPEPPKKRPDHIDDKYEDALRRRQVELESEIKNHDRKGGKQRDEMLMWGVMAPIAIALDTVALGAASGSIALISGLRMWQANRDLKKATAELQAVNEDLFHYLEQVKYKHLLEEKKKPDMPPSPAKDFQKAATPEEEIDLLRQKMAEFDKKFGPKNGPQP